jgi:hypothetical protein
VNFRRRQIRLHTQLVRIGLKHGADSCLIRRVSTTLDLVKSGSHAPCEKQSEARKNLLHTRITLPIFRAPFLRERVAAEVSASTSAVFIG